jgi:WD40 repeat protein
VRILALAVRGEVAYLGDSTGRLSAFSLPGQEVKRVASFEGAILSLLVSLAGQKEEVIICGLSNGQIAIVGEGGFESFQVHTAGVNALVSESHWLLSGSDDQNLVLFDLDRREAIFTFRNAHHSAIRALDCLKLSNNACLVASIGWDRRLKYWRVTSSGQVEVSGSYSSSRLVDVTDPTSVKFVGDECVLVVGRGLELLYFR